VVDRNLTKMDLLGEDHQKDLLKSECQRHCEIEVHRFAMGIEERLAVLTVSDWS